jgi:peptidyl-prolyl cis-trans isomerase SurA
MLKTLLVTALLASAALLGPSSPAVAQPATLQRIVAVVNENIISDRELGGRLDFAILVSGLPDDEATRRRLMPQVLRGLIDERLQRQEAARLRVAASEAEIDRAFADVAQRNNMTGEQLTAFLGSRGIDPAIMLDQLRAQVGWLKVVRRELESRVVVTREQIDIALKADRAGEEEVLVSEILLPVYEASDERAILQQAAELAQSVRGGADFAALARQLSAAASADAGGEIGWVRVSAVVPELQSVLARLQPGQISDPVRTPAGVQLFTVRERRQAGVRTGEADREAVRTRLRDEQLQRLASRYLRELRRSAFIDIRL